MSCSSNDSISEVILWGSFIEVIILPRLVPSSQLLIRERGHKSPVLGLSNINTEVVEQIVDGSSSIRERNNSISISAVDENLVTRFKEIRVKVSRIVGSLEKQVNFIVAWSPLEV